LSLGAHPVAHEVRHWQPTSSSKALAPYHVKLISAINFFLFKKWKTTPILEFIDDVPNKYCLKLKSKTLHNLFYTDRMKVVLILAMYHTMHRRSTLEVQVRGTSLMEYLYFAMIRLAKK
jgi:hypothetical protein